MLTAFEDIILRLFVVVGDVWRTKAGGGLASIIFAEPYGFYVREHVGA